MKRNQNNNNAKDCSAKANNQNKTKNCGTKNCSAKANQNNQENEE